jgi:hypothetical protein
MQQIFAAGVDSGDVSVTSADKPFADICEFMMYTG